MSYDTYYTLEIAEGGPSYDEVAAVIAGFDTGSFHGPGMADMTPAERAAHELELKTEFWKHIFEGDDETPWYDHDIHMREVSRRWPKTLFTLNGSGEEDGDIWVAYYQGGMGVKHRQPSWEPPTFDPADLTGGKVADQAKAYEVILKGAFVVAGDLNEADPHPFSAAVDDLVDMRNMGHHTLKVETVMANGLDAFVRFGDGTMLWFDYSGQTTRFNRVA